jgi:hypothetical protein
VIARRILPALVFVALFALMACRDTPRKAASSLCRPRTSLHQERASASNRFNLSDPLAATVNRAAGNFIRYTAYDAKADRMCQVLIGGHSQLITESDIRQFK